MRSILSLLQFTTILPVGKPQDFDCFARHSWIYPVAGYVIALLVALPVFFITNKVLAAAVATAGILILSGAHHFDGLLDFGDGVMARGNREKRIHALTDRYIGAGGVAAGLIITLLLFAGLQSVTLIIPALIIGEVCAKFSMVFLTAYGIPFKEGMHSYLHTFSRPYFPFLSLILCLPLVFLPVTPLQLVAAALVMIICPTILLVGSQKMFGGVNGDVVGAANEITRACVVIALALL
ncbi:MAG: adenosylcobinamide-GDP ribazoletransferase [Methanoregula sp.]|nr:adenosylcobinamide-GDP ribazoletransferase [Methanoregula sp.]